MTAIKTASAIASTGLRRMGLTAAAFLAFAVLPLTVLLAQDKAPAAANRTLPPTVDQLVQHFETIVFESEFKSVTPSKVIKKWAGPLRVAIREFEETADPDNAQGPRILTPVKVKKTFLTFVQRHLNTLAHETGIVTEDAKKTNEPPNFMINFVPRNQMANPNLVNADPALLKRMAAEGGCYFVLWADDKTGSIRQAVIVVNSERLSDRINHCLLEEMTQSLGLPNDSNVISPSIFHDDSRQTDLSRTDLIIVKALYDPRVKAGMAKAEALAKVKEVIAELVAKMPPE